MTDYTNQNFFWLHRYLSIPEAMAEGSIFVHMAHSPCSENFDNLTSYKFLVLPSVSKHF